MPVEKYFDGHGNEVMSSMRKTYGDKKGKSVFYATANKKGKTAAKAPKPHDVLAAPRGK
jgi:hypothetical protein